MIRDQPIAFCPDCFGVTRIYYVKWGAGFKVLILASEFSNSMTVVRQGLDAPSASIPIRK